MAVVVAIGAGVACLWLPRGRKAGYVEPRCASCAYIVHGLPAPTCPECGADLSKPGAIASTGRLPPGRLVRSVAWTFFCVLAILIPSAVIWSAFVMPSMPWVSDSTDDVTFLWPASMGYKGIAIRAHAHGLVHPHDTSPLPAVLKTELNRSDGTVRTLAVDAATLRFRDTSLPGNAMSSTPLDAQALVAWLKGASVQGETGQLNKEMAIVMTQVQQMVSHPTQRQVSTGSEFSGVSSTSGGSMSHFRGWVRRPWLSEPLSGSSAHCESCESH